MASKRITPRLHPKSFSKDLCFLWPPFPKGLVMLWKCTEGKEMGMLNGEWLELPGVPPQCPLGEEQERHNHFILHLDGGNWLCTKRMVEVDSPGNADWYRNPGGLGNNAVTQPSV